MREREYTLIEIIRAPEIWVYEVFELQREGHYYLYQYDAAQEVFYRATVPAGAACTQFYPLRSGDKVPISGWQRVEKKSRSAPRLQLIDHRKK